MTKWLRRAVALGIALAVLYVLTFVYARYGRVIDEPLACMFVDEGDWRRQEYMCGGQMVMLPFAGLILALGVLTFWAMLKVLPCRATKERPRQ